METIRSNVDLDSRLIQSPLEPPVPTALAHKRTDIQPKAGEKRQNMMKDSQETTIIMPLSQFKSAVLMDDASDFDETFGEGKASRVLTLFREALATSTETMEGSPTLILKEKDYSAAWVRISAHSLVADLLITCL